MSTFALRLPKSLHDHAKLLADADHASLNHFITLAVAEKVSALHTEAFFAQRAADSQPDDLAHFLAKVSNRTPINGGDLPS